MNIITDLVTASAGERDDAIANHRSAYDAAEREFPIPGRLPPKDQLHARHATATRWDRFNARVKQEEQAHADRVVAAQSHFGIVSDTRGTVSPAAVQWLTRMLAPVLVDQSVAAALAETQAKADEAVTAAADETARAKADAARVAADDAAARVDELMAQIPVKGNA